MTPEQEMKAFMRKLRRYRKSLIRLQSASREAALALGEVVESLDATAEVQGIEARLFPEANSLMMRLGEVITDMAEFFEDKE